MTSSWFFLSTLYRPCLLRGTSVILIYNSSASDYLMTIFRGFPPSQSKCWVRVQIKRRTERFSSPQTINFRPNAATEKLRHFILMKTHPPHTQIQPQMLHFFPSLIIQSSPIPFTSTYSLPIVSILAAAYLYKTQDRHSQGNFRADSFLSPSSPQHKWCFLVSFLEMVRLEENCGMEIKYLINFSLVFSPDTLFTGATRPR